MKSLFNSLFKPSQSLSVIVLLFLGGVIGVAGLFVFNVSLKATSTTAFCVSCHEMQEPYAALQNTTHYDNVHGFTVGCADCHIPKETLPKIKRKIQAAREVWGHWTGVIDAPEKYAAHRPAMIEHELARLKANDSQECRNCHTVAAMKFSEQSSGARKSHQDMSQSGDTCIDCHNGIAHGPVESDDEDMNFEL